MEQGAIMLHKILLSSVALIGLTGLAGAADMYVKAPSPVYVQTWTGCYIGGHAGYGTTTSSSQYTGSGLADSPQLNQNFDNKGFVGGGQAGCQLQTGTFLWGLEGDWSSFNNSSSKNLFYSNSIPGLYIARNSENQQVSYDSLWSVRGRFGGIFSDVYHLYATAGIGGAKANYSSSEEGGFSEAGPFGESGQTFQGASNVAMTATGIVYGAGAEWKIWPSFVVGAEYLHYALFSDTALPSSVTDTGPMNGDHVHTNNVDVIRVRASYLFNWWGR
jgi:outer membrane immunogenic protein